MLPGLLRKGNPKTSCISAANNHIMDTESPPDNRSCRAPPRLGNLRLTIDVLHYYDRIERRKHALGKPDIHYVHKALAEDEWMVVTIGTHQNRPEFERALTRPPRASAVRLSRAYDAPSSQRISSIGRRACTTACGGLAKPGMKRMLRRRLMGDGSFWALGSGWGADRANFSAA